MKQNIIFDGDTKVLNIVVIFIYLVIISSCKNQEIIKESNAFNTVTTDAKSTVAIQRSHNYTSKELEEHLNKIVIPMYVAEDLSLEYAFHHLYSMGVTEYAAIQPFHYNFEIKVENKQNKIINIKRERVNYLDLLTDICEAANVEWKIKQGVLVIRE